MYQVPDHEYFTKFLSPANPIISKRVQLDNELKLNLNLNTNNSQIKNNNGQSDSNNQGNKKVAQN